LLHAAAATGLLRGLWHHGHRRRTVETHFHAAAEQRQVAVVILILDMNHSVAHFWHTATIRAAAA
jgi:hypothetical protein